MCMYMCISSREYVFDQASSLCLPYNLSPLPNTVGNGFTSRSNLIKKNI